MYEIIVQQKHTYTQLILQVTEMDFRHLICNDAG